MPPNTCSIPFDKKAEETLLHQATCLGSKKGLLYCLENQDCNVNHCDNTGCGTLHKAGASGWVSITRLLEHRAEVNCSAQRGIRPIQNAVQNDYLNVVCLLLPYDADPMLLTCLRKAILEMIHSKPVKTFITKYFNRLAGSKC